HTEATSSSRPTISIGILAPALHGDRGLVERNLTTVSGAALALRELRRFARLVQAGLLALDDPCVAGQEACPLQRHAKLRVGLDERPCDAVADGGPPSPPARRRARAHGGRTSLRRPRP